MNIIALFSDFILIAFDIYEMLIFIYIVMSWFGGLPKNKFGYFIYDMIAPLFRLVDRIPQPRGFISLTALYALIMLWIVKAGVIVLLSYL